MNYDSLTTDEYHRLVLLAKTAGMFWLFPEHYSVIKKDFHGLLEELSSLEIDMMGEIKEFMENHPEVKDLSINRESLMMDENINE